MKRIFLLILTSVCIYTYVYSQEIVSYRTTECNPNKWNMFFTFDPIYMDLSGADANAGWEAMFDFRIRRFISLSACYRRPWATKKSVGGKRYWSTMYSDWHKKAYPQNSDNTNIGQLMTINEIKPFQWFEMGAVFHLSDRTKDIK